jgi:2-amino-4-hydroxy-6-hydroxymethyldihydropteridine diphosphokinase
MKAVIALGANIGNPQEQMDLAVAMLREATDFKVVSDYFSTKPVSDIAQPDYLNAVCIVESELPATDLLALLHGIEKTLGRERNEKWGPRTIDLDLIQYGSLLSSADELQLPHPRAHERRFVIEPWHSIEPDAILLTHGKISEILEQMHKALNLDLSPPGT